jgi:gamma-glutamyltranspeptidase/glutathione hydrolase
MAWPNLGTSYRPAVTGIKGASGVAYMVIKDAAAGDRPVVLDYIGRTPAAATPDQFPDEETKNTGIRSPLVPGAVGGWLMALERFGSLDRATVFAPAIGYARDGFPVTIKNNQFMLNSRANLRKWATSRAAYLHDGETPVPGAILKQPDLARTFETIVEGSIEAPRFKALRGTLLPVESRVGPEVLS